MVVIVLLTVLVALGFGGIGAILALRTGSVEAVESAFPLFFVAIFMSSINLPRDLIEAGLVPLHRDHQPDLLPGRRHQEPGHHRLGRAGSSLGFGCAACHRRGRPRRGGGIARTRVA